MTAREQGRALRDGDQFDAGPGYRWQFVGRSPTPGYCWLLDVAAARFYLCRTAVATSHATSSAEHQPTEFADGDLQTWKAAVKGGRGVEPETVAYGTVSDIPTERVNPAPVIDPWLIPTATRKEAPMAANKGVPLAERVPPTCLAQAGPPAIWCSRDEGHRPAAAHRFDKSTPPDGYEPKLADQRPDLLAQWIADHPEGQYGQAVVDAVTPYLRSVRGTDAGVALIQRARAAGESARLFVSPILGALHVAVSNDEQPVDSEGAPLTGPEPILEPATEDEGAPLTGNFDTDMDAQFESYRDDQLDRHLGDGRYADPADVARANQVVDPDTEPLRIGEWAGPTTEQEHREQQGFVVGTRVEDGASIWGVTTDQHDLIERAAEIDAVIKQGKIELDEIKAKLRSMLTPGTHVSSHGQAVVKTPTRTFKLDRGPALSDKALAAISELKVSPKLAKDRMPPEIHELYLEDGTSAVELTYSRPADDTEGTTDAEGEAFQWLA